MILPHINAGSLHARQRVAAFLRVASMDMPAMAALATRNANRNGIIRLTVTA
jgi:hypothetical protein